MIFDTQLADYRRADCENCIYNGNSSPSVQMAQVESEFRRATPGASKSHSKEKPCFWEIRNDNLNST